MKRIFTILSAVVFFLLLAGGAGFVYAEESEAPSETAKLVINEPGTYVLSGKMTKGVTVDVEHGDVILVLDNVNIASEDGPGILAVNADSLQIQITPGTFNRIADSKGNEKQAAIHTEVDTVFSGTGCLQIEGNSGNGILAKDADVTFYGGLVLILAEEYAFITEGTDPGTIYIRGASVFVNAKKAVAPKGTVIKISAGTLLRTNFTCIKQLYCCLNRASSETDEAEECDGCCSPTTDVPGVIIHGQVTNGAVVLDPDMDHAIRIEMNAETNRVEITAGGTYILAGACEDGSITVKKDVKGVVLILDNLELTNKQGAALLAEEGAQVKVVIKGSASLSNNSDTKGTIESEKNTELNITGAGELNLTAFSGNGIGMGQDSSLVMTGIDLRTIIKAKESGMSSGYDIAIPEGSLTIEAGTYGILADHILELGTGGASSPRLNVKSKGDGLQTTVININGGDILVQAGNDAIDTDDEAYEGVLTPSVNISGGTTKLIAGDDGIDSDGNINLIDGSLTLEKGDEDSDSCMTFDGDLYISDNFEIECDCTDDCCMEPETVAYPYGEWEYTADENLGYFAQELCECPVASTCPAQ